MNAPSRLVNIKINKANPSSFTAKENKRQVGNC